ncbi:MBL fold metallo-hydrolase [uncultured Porphyromonas sp.]|uniref:MBL fold metallo-hydrolase n=1 Tax=uncultured Porphyromonas sp. TaxID=159274 RepID=UPI00262C50DE|nr:MBL fold metallo-hydrolase [uncultured Porphyromonas sp.]
MLQYKRFTVNMVQVNSYLLWDESKIACIVDPGFSNERERQMLCDFIELHQLQLERSLATHLHFDHVLGARFIEDHFGIITEAGKNEIVNVPSLDKQLVAFGIPQGEESFSFDPKPIKEPLRFGNTTLEILETPGHSPGHVSFYNSESGVLLCGDVLFKNGMGRYDLWGGDYATLMNSISKLLQLPGETIVLPGHGLETSIQAERANF